MVQKRTAWNIVLLGGGLKLDNRRVSDRWEQKQHQANGHRGAETTKASSRTIVANGSHCILIFFPA